MKYFISFIISIFILFALYAITDGIKGIVKVNSNESPNWEKVVGTLQNVKFVDNLELRAEYNFIWQNRLYQQIYTEMSTFDTSKRIRLEMIFERLKNAKQISIWVNTKNISESSIFPLSQNQLSKSIYSIQFGITWLIFLGSLLLFLWVLKSPELRVLKNIIIIESI